jgi:predicted nucleic acid-binding protein
LRAVRKGRIAADDARAAIQLFLRLPFETVELSGAVLAQFISRAYELAERYSTSYYDALFVTTSEFTGIPLVTADEPLLNAYNADFEVVWLGDLQLP